MFKHFIEMTALSLVLVVFAPFRTLSAQTAKAQESGQIWIPSTLDAVKPAGPINGEDFRRFKMNVKPSVKEHGFRIGPLELKEHRVEPWRPQLPYYLQSHEETVDVHWR